MPPKTQKIFVTKNRNQCSMDSVFLYVFIIIVIGVLLYALHHYWWLSEKHRREHSNTTVLSTPVPVPLSIGGISSRLDVFNNPYIPPVKMDGYIFEKTSGDVRGLPPIISPIQVPGYLPVNVETRGVRGEYNQVGILTKIGKEERNNNNKRRMFSGEENDSDGNIENTLILPLMGRRSLTGRDKWQYYTISNTGSLYSKLPVRVRGKSCSSEYGCVEMMDGDVVHVDGYNHKFKATVYDNATFSYIPVL